jgi:hypothetical protein
MVCLSVYREKTSAVKLSIWRRMLRRPYKFASFAFFAAKFILRLRLCTLDPLWLSRFAGLLCVAASRALFLLRQKDVFQLSNSRRLKIVKTR